MKRQPPSSPPGSPPKKPSVKLATLLNRPAAPKSRKPPLSAPIKGTRMLYMPDEIDQKLSGLPAKAQLAFWRIIARSYEFNRVEANKEQLAAIARCDPKTTRHHLLRFTALALAIYHEDRHRLLVNPWLMFRGNKDEHRRACEEWMELKAAQLRIVK